MPAESQTLDNGKFGAIKWTCVLDIADLPTKMSEIRVKAEKSVLKVTGKSSFDMIENGFKFGLFEFFWKFLLMCIDIEAAYEENMIESNLIIKIPAICKTKAWRCATMPIGQKMCSFLLITIIRGVVSGLRSEDSDVDDATFCQPRNSTSIRCGHV